MSASNQTPPLTGQPTDPYAPYGYRPVGPPPQTIIDPNNPPWGIAAGILTWVGSVALLFIVAIVLVLPYAMSHAKGMTQEQMTKFLTTDPTALFLQIVSAIPAHLLTLFIVWAVVTRFGKRPFWKSLGWGWSEKVGFWKTLAFAVLLFLVGYGISELIKGKPTDIDQIVNSSMAARYVLAGVAGISAPFVEELVYRGVLYSALQKAAGMLWAVVIVSILFALVHVLEYRNNIGVILAISVLSFGLTLLRAYSGRLLPCFIVHLIFNGITAIYIIVEPYLPKSAPDLERKAPAITMLWRTVRPLF